MTTTSKKDKGKHAVIMLSASMGGLLAARALVDTFEKVMMLERLYLCIGIIVFGVASLPIKD
jgi:alpha-beta hydrolase superfamily lysophospholipase